MLDPLPRLGSPGRAVRPMVADHAADEEIVDYAAGCSQRPKRTPAPPNAPMIGPNTTQPAMFKLDQVDALRGYGDIIDPAGAYGRVV